jgi:hypothetical protein
MREHELSKNQSKLSKCLRLAVALLLLQLSLVSVANVQASTDDDDDDLKAKPSNIKARGAFTCDFTIPAGYPLDIAPVIERDRMYMAERPGMQRKQIPIRFDQMGNVLSGGRYLFDTRRDAAKYKLWVENDFALDGTLFFDRPYFLSPDCHAWGVVGAHNFKDVPQQVVVRTERWSVPQANQKQTLKQRWPLILADADQRGLTGVWLLYNKEEGIAQLVYFADRIAAPDPNVPDFASLGALESASALGNIFASQQGWTKTFDRTQWVLTVWFPFDSGDHGAPSLWPNSPPLPEPYPGDGVCEVSRGENQTNAPGDCGPTCGNGVCDADETTHNCPGDCRLD